MMHNQRSKRMEMCWTTRLIYVLFRCVKYFGRFCTNTKERCNAHLSTKDISNTLSWCGFDCRESRSDDQNLFWTSSKGMSTPISIGRIRHNGVGLSVFFKRLYARRSVIGVCLQVHGRLGLIYTVSPPTLVSCHSCFHTRSDISHGAMSGGLHLCCDKRENMKLYPTVTW